jgi:hypothetical protein
MAQGVGPEFKPQYHKKKNKTDKSLNLNPSTTKRKKEKQHSSLPP